MIQDYKQRLSEFLSCEVPPLIFIFVNLFSLNLLLSSLPSMPYLSAEIIFKVLNLY